MPAPRITFACELSSERLAGVFGDRSVIATLRHPAAGWRWRLPTSARNAHGGASAR
jgi:hypothetical protein